MSSVQWPSSAQDLAAAAWAIQLDDEETVQESFWAPIDPFKASVVYSLNYLWPQTRLDEEDIEAKPPPRRQHPRRPSTHYPPGIRQPTHPPLPESSARLSIPISLPPPRSLSRPPTIANSNVTAPLRQSLSSRHSRSRSPQTNTIHAISPWPEDQFPRLIIENSSIPPDIDNQGSDLQRESQRSEMGSYKIPLPRSVSSPRSRVSSSPGHSKSGSQHRSTRSPASLAHPRSRSEIFPPESSLQSRPRSPVSDGHAISPILVQGQHIPSIIPNDAPEKPSSSNSNPEKGSLDAEAEISADPVKKFSGGAYILAFVIDTLPRQLYLYLLLRLPYLYFSRVTRIFEEAEMTMPEIKQGILAAAAHRKLEDVSDIEPPSFQFQNLEQTWQSFIDTLLREWKTLNIISVLLLSAILTILQIDSAANDALTRFLALTSMMCAIMSLLFGCIYLIRFGTMRKAYKAAEWAQESKKLRTGIFWNVWVLLAMPAIWLAWSIILYVICIMAFIWKTGTFEEENCPPKLKSDTSGANLATVAELLPRIVASVALLFGLVYFALVVSTLRRYGDRMDHTWRRRIIGWMRDDALIPHSQHFGIRRHDPSFSPLQEPHYSPSIPRRPVPVESQWSPPSPIVVVSQPMYSYHNPNLWDTRSRSSKNKSSHRGRSTNAKESMVDNRSSFQPEPASEDRKIKLTKLLVLSDDIQTNPPPYGGVEFSSWKMSESEWQAFTSDVLQGWRPYERDQTMRILEKWNEMFFRKSDGQVALCEEFKDSSFQHAIYHFSTKNNLSFQQSRYDSLPQGFWGLDIYPLNSTSPGSSDMMDIQNIAVRISLRSIDQETTDQLLGHLPPDQGS